MLDGTSRKWYWAENDDMKVLQGYYNSVPKYILSIKIHEIDQ